MKINKDTLKKSLTLEQIEDLVANLGGEPNRKNDNTLICKTICHCGNSHKLYFYFNQGEGGLFHCYTECSDSMDVFELVKKVKTLETNREWTLPQAINFVASYFGYSAKTFDFDEIRENLPDWDNFKNYEKINLIGEEQKVELKTFDDSILKYLPTPRIIPWEQEGITKEVIHQHNICYDPVNQGIVIPHYNIDGQLIGIRERTLIKENEIYGKYKPATIAGKMYNHPLSFNLYNLNNSKENISLFEKAIIFEGEKSCLLYASYFGENQDITVASCGQNITMFQLKLLKSIGAKEIIIAFDREGQNDDKSKYVQKFYNLKNKFGAFCQLSFIYDKEGSLLNYKMSPIDNGKDIFLKLYEERIFL